MKKVMILVIAMLVITGLAMAQKPFVGGSYASGTGIPFNIDKLGAHQNGGRGCVGCHAPHSGARGNGGNAMNGTVTDPDAGDEVLWGQDLGPLYGKTTARGAGGRYAGVPPATMAGDEAQVTGI